jgi:hypothetical protein
MSTEPTNGSETKVSTKSARYKNQVGKSPWRVAAGRRLHAEGLAGMGGRKPTHGRRALAELVRRGEELDGPIGELTRTLEAAYTVDYGGDLSTAEKALVKRLVMLDVDLALLIAERDKAARFTRADAVNHAQAVTRNCSAFSALVKVMGGPGRRAKETDREFVIKRWDAPKPDNGTRPRDAARHAGRAGIGCGLVQSHYVRSGVTPCRRS